jgi:hypothetical protein
LILLAAGVMSSAGSYAVVQELRIPDRLWECETRESETCGVWTFRGSDGSGQWPDGAAAKLVVQQFDPAWIIIRRSDDSGALPGLTGTYVGKLTGGRIEGKVTWSWLGHWNEQVEGTWYATFSEPSPAATAPRPAPNAPKTGRRVPLRAPGTGGTSGGTSLQAQAEQVAPPSGGSPGQTEICGSKWIRFAMESIEMRAIHDPNAAFLSLLTLAFTGVAVEGESAPGSAPATIIGSRNGTDGGRYTAQDPGSFVCTGVFVHGDVHIAATKNADLAGELSAAAMKGLMATHPPYLEWFKVKPLEIGRYRLTLLPAGLELSREYSTEFSYPAR